MTTTATQLRPHGHFVVLSSSHLAEWSFGPIKGSYFQSRNRLPCLLKLMGQTHSDQNDLGSTSRLQHTCYLALRARRSHTPADLDAGSTLSVTL